MNRLISVLGCMLLVWSAWGCSRGDGPELGVVRGTVSLDGEPITNASVTFWLGTGRPSVGVPDAAGRYELRFTVNQTGALIGEHRVYISTAVPQQDDTTSTERIPAKFNVKSTLVREVKPGTNIIDFDIQSS
jgi:hypothetical protein